MTMSEHTIKAFDTELQDLTRVVVEMGGLAERQIVNALEALEKHDTGLAQRVIADDAKIDVLQREVEEKAILTIARRQPMAVDLREIVGALRVSNDLERIGDLAKNIAKRVVALNGDFPPQRLIRGVEHLADLVLELRRMPHRDRAVHDVAVPAADPLPLDVAGLDEVGEDPLRRALGDPDGLGDVPEPHVRVAGDAEQHLRVIGDEPPGPPLVA